MKHAIALLLFASVLLAACGSGAPEQSGAPAETPGLSASELENGIGPIQTVSLTAIDEALAARGQELFTMKCSACHKMAERYVGPPLAEVTTIRSPAFVMNMILNPAEMIEKHPEVRKMLAQYMSAMPNQQLSEDDARAVLEYLRTQAQ
ncbi:MAG: cytochrome c [Rhodothermales bacterium]|nr:cytochrome c [Rhodothermales bacterium]MBO6780027.1 cytochrome c [Rhodothermales bacterium]